MKIEIWSIGKKGPKPLEQLVNEYIERINHYYPCQLHYFESPRHSERLPRSQQLQMEAQLIQQKLKTSDTLVVLDEKGITCDSIRFANWLNQWTLHSTQRVVILIGGSHGTDMALRQSASLCIRLSDLTFPHLLVRLILSEQLYRACTILRNEKYHHE